MSTNPTPESRMIQDAPTPVAASIGTARSTPAVPTHEDVEALLLTHRCAREAIGAVGATYHPRVG